MSERLCVHPGCGHPRWLGKSGTNSNLTMCERHQREYWRNQKAARRPAPIPKEKRQRPGPKPKAPKAHARCKKTITIDYARGIFKEQQVMKLDDFKQLDMMLESYRSQGYKVVEKGSKPCPVE